MLEKKVLSVLIHVDAAQQLCHGGIKNAQHPAEALDQESVLWPKHAHGKHLLTLNRPNCKG